jgi:hypothetical protein
MGRSIDIEIGILSAPHWRQVAFETSARQARARLTHFLTSV